MITPLNRRIIKLVITIDIKILYKIFLKNQINKEVIHNRNAISRKTNKNFAKLYKNIKKYKHRCTKHIIKNRDNIQIQFFNQILNPI
jgi:hypothetical protein